MTLRVLTRDIKQKLYDQFLISTIDPVTQVQWPNQSFKFPKNERFARVFILTERRQQEEMNNATARTSGSVQCSIYSPGRTSTEDHQDQVEIMMPSLDLVELGKTRFETSVPLTVGRLDAYWVTRIETTFVKYDPLY